MTATLLQTTNTYLVGSPDRATLTITNSDQPVFTMDGQPKHVIVHWDGTSFVTTDLINTNAINYEQATFAPVSFDSH